MESMWPINILYSVKPLAPDFWSTLLWSQHLLRANMGTWFEFSHQKWTLKSTSIPNKARDISWFFIRSPPKVGHHISCFIRWSPPKIGHQESLYSGDLSQVTPSTSGPFATPPESPDQAVPSGPCAVNATWLGFNEGLWMFMDVYGCLVNIHLEDVYGVSISKDLGRNIWRCARLW